MFKRSFPPKDRVGKITKPPRNRSFRDDAKQRLREQLNQAFGPPSAGSSPRLNSAVVTIAVGADQRLFAAHEDVLCHSPYFADACRRQFFNANIQPEARRIKLADEEPEVFSAVLEYLYKGDYYPRLLHDEKRNTWVLEDDQSPAHAKSSPDPSKVESLTIYHRNSDRWILRDTAVYCAAVKYDIPELKRLALRKQSLITAVDIATVLCSARFVYENTPDSDSRLRAHYLALIIRSRKAFKRSATMQSEMEIGGRMFFDLFVAMSNHIDDVQNAGSKPTLRDV